MSQLNAPPADGPSDVVKLADKGTKLMVRVRPTPEGSKRWKDAIRSDLKIEPPKPRAQFVEIVLEGGNLFRPEIITYDELYERAKFIVASSENPTQGAL